ncbi:MAG TPA: TatD family hydrolase [Micropepsaceae bacterium]|nr:TatD family hydrolase [Micropepsaceae bacterium]
MLVDSHCHLDFPEFAPELEAVLARARQAGIGHFLTIGTALKRFPGVRAVAETAADIHCTVGVHPHEAAEEPLSGPDVLLKESLHEKVVGFGESGLDYYYNHSPRDAQIANFRAHIAAARAAKLPLVVHTREADDDTIAILREEQERNPITGVIHCFTGTARLAGAALEFGFYISVSGIATFKKSDVLRATLKDVPLNRLLVETDAPYLAPQPVRGKRNEPTFMVHTAAMLAELKDVTAEEIAAATTENFFRLFTKARPT